MTDYDFDSRRIESDPDEDQFRALISVATTLRWVAAGLLAFVLLLGTCSVSLLASQSCATTGEGGLDPLVECVR